MTGDGGGGSRWWRVLVLVVCALVLSACGASTEHLSPAQVSDKIDRLATPQGAIHSFRVFFVAKDNSSSYERTMFVACPPARNCVLIDRHGSTYADMQEYVDNSDDIRPGFDVLANSDPLHPVQQKPKLATYTPSTVAKWVWFAVVATALLLLWAGWYVLRRRRPTGPDVPVEPR